eukprot:GHVR01050427.1.p1 GENE.GHVR01050427.1~~GHVR01050427.1.p1  ORF type:complete len:178 (+),score=28.18 GHVR01050427.1:3-536(+)
MKHIRQRSVLRKNNDKWEYESLIELTILEGTCPEQVFINKYINIRETSPTTQEQQDNRIQNIPITDGEPQSNTPIAEDISVTHELTPQYEPIAEDISVTNEALIVHKENEAKGHLDVTDEEIRAGTHDNAMREELYKFETLNVLDTNTENKHKIPTIKMRWVHTWKQKGDEYQSHVW